MTPRTTDEVFMRRALQLADRGRGLTSPNPIVGAVVTRDGEVVGEGFHARAGAPHAEIEALRAAGARARDATLSVPRAPCNHPGRTAARAPGVLAARAPRGVAAVAAPTPFVAGAGAGALGAGGAPG